MARNVIKITSGGKKLEKSANLIEDAKSEVSVARDKLNGCKGASSTMGGILATAYINAGVNVLLKTIQKEMDLLDDTRSVILDDKKALVSVDKIKNKVKADLNNRDLKSLKKSYSSLVGAIGVKKAKNWISKLKLGDKVVFSKNAKSILRLKKNKNSKSGSESVSNTTSTAKTGAKVLHGDVVDANLSAIANLKQRLKKALKNGNKKKAYNIYKSLVGLVGVNQAKKYLSNLGYKVGKNSNGEKIIKQIKDEKMNDKSSNNNGDKKKEIPEDPQKIGNDDDKKDDKPENPDDSGNDDPGDSGTGDDGNGNEEPTTPEENPSNNDNSGGESNPSSESVATPSEDNNSNNSNNYSSGGNDNVSNVSTNNDNYSDSGSSSNDSSGDGLVFDDSSSNNSSDSNVDASTLVPSDTLEDDTIDDDVVSTPTKKVKTLEDDTTTSTSSSKSGLGVAVPLGLGVVATGAAAVAGARYIKNKKESTYDDNYDDENNDLGDDNSDYSYSDTSSNYDSDSYMSDDYLGPAGSSYTDTNLDENSNNSDSVSDSYIDSEEYEDDSNDDDLVLRDLN